MRGAEKRRSQGRAAAAARQMVLRGSQTLQSCCRRKHPQPTHHARFVVELVPGAAAHAPRPVAHFALRVAAGGPARGTACDWLTLQVEGEGGVAREDGPGRMGIRQCRPAATGLAAAAARSLWQAAPQPPGADGARASHLLGQAVSAPPLRERPLHTGVALASDTLGAPSHARAGLARQAHSRRRHRRCPATEEAEAEQRRGQRRNAARQLRRAQWAGLSHGRRLGGLARGPDKKNWMDAGAAGAWPVSFRASEQAQRGREECENARVQRGAAAFDVGRPQLLGLLSRPPAPRVPQAADISLPQPHISWAWPALFSFTAALPPFTAWWPGSARHRCP